jgi:adenylate cyclase
MKKSPPLNLLIPAGIVLAAAILALTGLTAGLDDKIYDLYIKAIPAPKQDASILFVNFDDPAVSAIGTWPIGRNITADGLMLLREMGAEYALFDIEYVEKSPRGVNADLLTEELPTQVSEDFGNLSRQASELFSAIARGQISVKDADDYVGDLEALSASYRDSVLGSLARVARDNDLYLAQAARFFGKAFFTVNMQELPNTDVKDEARKLAVERFALKKVSGALRASQNRVDVQPVISPILDQAYGLGFPNVIVDPDGVRRRVELVLGYGKAYFPQLALAPVLDRLGNPELQIRKGSILVKGAKLPSGVVKDLRVPLTAKGEVLVNWPHVVWADSFRHLSFYYLYQHDLMYRDLVSNIKARDSWGYFSQYQGDKSFLELAKLAEQYKSDIMEGLAPPEEVATYRALRDSLISESGAFLDSEPEKGLLEMIEAALADKGLSAAERAQYQQIKEDLPGFFAKTRKISVELRQMRDKIAKAAQGSFCIVGQTNTGSTDLGINPFQRSFPNVGTHASVANMFFTDDFISDLSPLWSVLAAAALCLGLGLAIKRLSPALGISLGAGVSVLAAGLALLFFALTKRYLPVVPLVGPVLLTFVSLVIVNFLAAEKEKGFIRNAFSHYLSAEVIKQIVSDPSRLKLGGDKKVMTAIFTDIRGFSTISEKLDPEQLVALLNQYLTTMSDIILDLGGTIDKYEGDAIISFFGAPLDLPDHAERACLAAIRMKAAEAEANHRFISEGIAPSPLLTRIGINTGEMVVGNMGTTKKMDYTIIGDSVNLAARLEGVNKQYGSWILASEDSISQAGPGIVARRMDRIKVVGKNVPIRIYEVMGEKGKVDPGVPRLMELFHEALDLHEARDWKGAIAAFEAILRDYPDDGPSQTFLKRSRDYLKTPPPANWDGVFALNMK